MNVSTLARSITWKVNFKRNHRITDTQMFIYRWAHFPYLMLILKDFRKENLLCKLGWENLKIIWRKIYSMDFINDFALLIFLLKNLSNVMKINFTWGKSAQWSIRCFSISMFQNLYFFTTVQRGIFFSGV